MLGWKLMVWGVVCHHIATTYASPRVVSFPVASSSDGGGALSFLVPKIRFIVSDGHDVCVYECVWYCMSLYIITQYCC